MDHFDWIGAAAFVSSVTASVVALLAALQSLRNHTAIQNVDKRLDGAMDKIIGVAKAAGHDAAVTARLEADAAANLEARSKNNAGQGS